MCTKNIIATFTCIFLSTIVISQKTKKQPGTYPHSIAPVGIIQRLSDSALLDVVQRQTFRYFWHFAHPGFVDGFSIHHNWYATTHLPIDQGAYCCDDRKLPKRFAVEFIYEDP